MNVRFWDYVNGSHVKLTLRPNQELSHSQGGPTEEGWSRRSETWLYDAETQTVYRAETIDGVDCDGRLTQYFDDHCPATNLRQVSLPACPDILQPDWQVTSRSQRDYSAEAMGY